MINVENNQECFVLLWRRLERTRRLLGGQCKRYCIRNILKAWFGSEATDDFIRGGTNCRYPVFIP